MTSDRSQTTNPTTDKHLDYIREIARDIAADLNCDEPPCGSDCTCWRDALDLASEELPHA